MLSWFRSRAEDRRTAIDFYGAIVAQARQPELFAAGGGPDAPGIGIDDTPEGRAAMIILALFPVLERLQAGSARERRIARGLSETFITDIDDCLREMGVGDMAVPKKVKRAAQALGENCLAYRRALASPEAEKRLEAELATTLPGLANNPQGATALAKLVLAHVAAVNAAPLDQLLAGSIRFPTPMHMKGTV